MGIWETFTTDKQWKQYLQDLLKRNDTALKKAIVLIYDRQTAEEKYTGRSIEDNNIGFSKWDASEMATIAMDIKAGRQLSAGQLAKSRNKMVKYWKQLMVISKQQMADKQRKQQQELQQQSKLQFKHNIAILQDCAQYGIPCEYGICDECPVTTGLQ